MARVPAVAQQAARQSAAAAAMQGAAFRPHQPNVTSSLMSRQIGVALAAAADPVAAPGDGDFASPRTTLSRILALPAWWKSQAATVAAACA
jgi:hypothetical protein